jgi:hypothetical protein
VCKNGNSGILRRLRADERIIALGILAHVLAFFCIPALHLLGHRDDHRHLAGGGIEIVALQDDGGEHRGQSGQPDHGVPDPSHGSGSMEHFDVAPLAPAPFLLPPPAVDGDELRPLPARSVFLGRIEDDTRATRGPPRA